MKKQWLLILAGGISSFGSGLTIAALPVLFFRTGHLNGSAVYNGFAAFGEILGAVLIMGWVDRLPRNWTAAGSDIVRGLLLIPMILIDSPPWEIFLIYAIIEGVFGSATNMAIQAWITEHTQDQRTLTKANSSLQLSLQLGKVLAMGLAPVLVATANLKWVFILDAATFFIGALIVFGLPSHISRVQAKISAIQETIEGFRIVARSRVLLKWIGVSLFHGLLMVILNSYYLVVLTSHLNASEWQLSTFQLAYFLGGMLGSAALMRLKTSPVQTIAIGLSYLCLMPFIMFFSPNYWFFFAASVVQSAATVAIAVSTRVLCQSAETPDASGRILAARSIVLDVGTVASTALLNRSRH